MKRERKRMVRKSNAFIYGRYRLGLHQQKILLLILSQLKMDQKEFIPYRVSWADIKRVSKGVLNSSAQINKACKNLSGKVISIKSGPVVDNFVMLAGWKVHAGKYVEFRIDPSMKDMLLGLLEDGNFTLYELECALALSSKHAIRLYEVLKSNAWKKQPVIIKLDDLKYSLGVLDSKGYVDFGSFRHFILDKGQKDIAKHADISFSYKPIKDGRKVGAIAFRIKSNQKYQKSILAEVARKHVLPGDVVLINGEECVVDSSACFYQKKAIPIGQLSQMLKAGDISIVQEADKK